jgi:uncharacterized protein YwlG (UPF0340 family)
MTDVQLQFDPSRVSLEAAEAVGELLAESALKKGQILVVGCSSSEIVG